ncbi:MAG: sarcosine oxidase subunit delta [Pseudomonadota bacterium]
MRLTCPYCGERDHQEFTYRGDASATRPAIESTAMDDHLAYVYDRKNPDGVHRELWNHTSGCRMHLVVTRNTVTHEVTGCEPVGPWAKKLKAASARRGAKR